MKMCHKRGLRMVWNSVMRKKMGFSCVLSKRTSNDILSDKSFRKQRSCTKLYAEVFARRRSVLWLQLFLPR